MLLRAKFRELGQFSFDQGAGHSKSWARERFCTGLQLCISGAPIHAKLNLAGHLAQGWGQSPLKTIGLCWLKSPRAYPINYMGKGLRYPHAGQLRNTFSQTALPKHWIKPLACNQAVAISQGLPSQLSRSFQGLGAATSESKLPHTAGRAGAGLVSTVAAGDPGGLFVA